eukprot:TRINITY_DN16360_c0_g1_i1.p1 TRINITY_DN16360_c0_g1~~TRINITY_DN16360_c0_g1_i1.p1  ORF type:complete len:486 (+),score=86.70 TRINITY_DN16360_c0_g1_i1:71-1459(+)
MRNTYPFIIMLVMLSLVMISYLSLLRRIQSLENQVATLSGVSDSRPLLHQTHKQIRNRLSNAKSEETENDPDAKQDPIIKKVMPSPAPITKTPSAPKIKTNFDTSDSKWGLLQRFGLLSEDEYLAKKERSKKWIVKSKYFAHMANPTPYLEMKASDWEIKPIRQASYPQFQKKTDKRYFEGYKYPKPHLCPGAPYECNGNGICDYTRGVCQCIPPYTGWECTVSMTVSDVNVKENEFTQDECLDQKIYAPSAEKWDARTEERCRSMNDTNGMWLGLTKKISRVIALSIATTLGVEPGNNVLDIGMGCGDLSEFIKEKVDVNLYGIDYSAAAVKYVRERHSGTFCVADVRELDFIPTASIDFAFENGVFSVTRDRHCETYKNVIRALKPGGTMLVMQTHTNWHPVKCWQNIKMQSIEKCLSELGVRMEYILTREITGGEYDSYCAGETYTALFTKQLNSGKKN